VRSTNYADAAPHVVYQADELRAIQL